jgi:hypothetical protein
MRNAFDALKAEIRREVNDELSRESPPGWPASDVSPTEAPHGQGSRIKREGRQAVRGTAQEGNEQVPRSGHRQHAGCIEEGRKELRERRSSSSQSSRSSGSGSGGNRAQKAAAGRKGGKKSH